MPKNYFVNDIKADLHDADTVYVVVDDHKSGNFSPYILKSSNRGKTWRSISRGLPERLVLQNRVGPNPTNLVDHERFDAVGFDGLGGAG